MNGLLTDLYQLTMAAGYVQAGKARQSATFELFLRHLPPDRNYVVAAGLAQAVEYLLGFGFTGEEIDYLRGLPQFSRAPAEFFEALRGLRFTGDVFAVPEGTPIFAGEPILTVRAPLIEAQIPETYLLATIGFQTMVATKAARMVEAAAGRPVVEFGTRRAHSPEAGVLAGRAGYIGGCIGTSNTLTGLRYGVPVFGTAAHSWVQSFASETESFRELQKLLGTATVYLVDTYDTLEGTRRAAALGAPLWGVRLDSGNLAELSRAARAILDRAGLRDARIMVSGDLNEYKILEMSKERLPIDSYGVGTELATSGDAPRISVVYKIVELEDGGARRYTLKLSEEKETLPGAKQVFRYADHDLLGRADECPGAEPQALLAPVIVDGELVAPLPDAHAARAHAAECREKLPTAYRSLFTATPPYRVEHSQALRSLYDETRRAVRR
ncbi:MAG: nicotinate phosphoribosyltransferase [Bryobacteraceae bacterium]|nr:nicotinate phosphoribosyltransferase [Bryobacteraceae bacterium]